MKHPGYTASDYIEVAPYFDLNSPSPPSLPTKPVFREIKPTYFIQSSFFRTFFTVLFISGIALFFVFTEIETVFLTALVGSLAFSLINLFVKFLNATEAYEKKVKQHRQSLSDYEKQMINYEQERKQYEIDIKVYERIETAEKEKAYEENKRMLAEREKTTLYVEGTGSSSNIISRTKEKLQQEVFALEKRNDLTEDQKVKQLITIFSTTCAAIAIQPIPFADIFVLTPIQGIMGKKIADIKGYSITESGAIDVFKEIAGLVGLGLLAQQLVIGAYKTVIPFLGAITTIPLVFGLTYGMGYVMDYYFEKKIKNERIEPEVIKDIFKRARAEGKKKAKENKEEINQSKKMM
jgi:uncharacterized protein (DUF697 family)